MVTLFQYTFTGDNKYCGGGGLKASHKPHDSTTTVLNEKPEDIFD